MLTTTEQKRFDQLFKKITCRKPGTREELRRYLHLQVKRRAKA